MLDAHCVLALWIGLACPTAQDSGVEAAAPTLIDAEPMEASPAPDVIGSAPGAGTLFLHPVRVPLRGGGFVTVERGMLFSRLVRSDPSSAIVGVEVYRFRAGPNASPDTPPVFRLYGGPGWPGLDLEVGDYEDDVLPFTEFGDLVIVGQRGIGTSKPNTLCEELPAPPAGVELGREEQDAALREACVACRSYWESQGYDLRGFNVIEAAADVDDVRRLLGYDEITLWGGSFGSHWGMAVLRYHPEGVARAVLTGMEGPDHTYDMPSGVLAALERIAGEAEFAPELVDHVPDEGLIEAFKGVIARAEAEPIEVTLKRPGTGEELTVVFAADDVRDLALGYTNRTSSRRGATTWPADVIALARGEFERAARARLENGVDLSLPTASFFMLDCGSGISPAREAILNADPAAQVVGALGRWYQTTCPSWGADVGEDFRSGFVTDVPTVIVQGTWDTSTPFDNALELLDSFRNHRFVIVDGGSHGALGEAMNFSDDFSRELLEFVVTGDLEGLPEEIRMPPVAWAPPYSSR